MGEINAQVPNSTEEQISYLMVETGLTQTQIIILAIDRLAQSYRAESNTLNKWTVESAAWTNQRLEYEAGVMRQQDLKITPETLSEFFIEQVGLPLSVQETANWLATQDWYRSKQDMSWSDEAQAYMGTTSDGRRVRVEKTEMAEAAQDAGVDISNFRRIAALKDPDIWAGLADARQGKTDTFGL